MECDKVANSTKILYEHLKDYPTSTEGYHEISAPAVAAALYCDHLPAPGHDTAGPRSKVERVGAAQSERRPG